MNNWTFLSLIENTDNTRETEEELKSLRIELEYVGRKFGYDSRYYRDVLAEIRILEKEK